MVKVRKGKKRGEETRRERKEQKKKEKQKKRANLYKIHGREAEGKGLSPTCSSRCIKASYLS